MKRAALLSLAAVIPCLGYSALTHEAIVDSLWASTIRPLLLKKFPGATPDELKQAHAYAFGGCQIQDMGYFPFASHEFSDLTHYVRTGDFVIAMIGTAQTIDEYAFALGALAHYVSDNTGHPTVNRSTALVYPKLRQRFGPSVTYEQNPADHLKVEFSFDVVQVARGMYAPDDYHNFIGFEVSKPVLERAFLQTYGIEMKEIFGTLDLGIGTYRFTVGTLIPTMTKVAWDSKRSDIQQLSPGLTRAKFVFRLPKKEYDKKWKGAYRQPGVFTRFLAFIFRMMPTVGPFKVLSFKPVPPEAEKDFLRTFDETVARYREKLNEAGSGNLKLANTNLDTGKATQAGVYKMADQSYTHLLDRLAKNHFAGASPEILVNIQSFFAQAAPGTVTEKTRSQLDELKSLGPLADRPKALELFPLIELFPQF